jgi:hypothetical protein
MLLSLQHRFGHNYVFVTNYTDSYCLSDYDFGAALATPTNSQPFNRHADWGPCVFDTQPLNVTTGKDQSLTALNNDRPNQVLSNVYPATGGCASAPCDQWLNPAAFVPNPVGTFGNVGRNEMRGPSTVNIDAALSRVFKFNERYKLEVRAEAFNVINHTNFVGAISPAGLVQAFSVMNSNQIRGHGGLAFDSHNEGT